MAEYRLIIDAPAAGAWNMAVDEALLLDAVENGVATLRFYEWDTPTLSLGYFQKYDDRGQHAASLACACVRRQTGGGAILHDRELTYSLALPADHSLACQSEKLYSAVHDAFIKTLDSILGDKRAEWVWRRRDRESSIAACNESFLCFQRRARGDLVLESQEEVRQSSASASPRDWKILGSAQRRYRGAVLQHGSLLLKASSAAPELLGIGDLCGKELPAVGVATAVCPAIAAVFRPLPPPMQLPRELHRRADHLANTKYGAAAWTKRR